MHNSAFDTGIPSKPLETDDRFSAEPSSGLDPVELAACAREIADFISGHAAATREYQRRIEELEAELAKSRTAAAESKTQLAAVLQLVDVLKPSA